MLLKTLPNGNGEGQLQHGGKDIRVPTYTVKRKNGEGEEWDVICSYKELQEILEEYDLQQVYKPIAFVSGTRSHATSRTDDGWKDHLKEIKKKAGRGNTINI